MPYTFVDIDKALADLLSAEKAVNEILVTEIKDSINEVWKKQPNNQRGGKKNKKSKKSRRKSSRRR